MIGGVFPYRFEGKVEIKECACDHRRAYMNGRHQSLVDQVLNYDNWEGSVKDIKSQS